MSKRQKMERKALCSKVQEYLESSDKEMRQLGRKLCHQHRLNYWVECIPTTFDSIAKKGILGVSRISLRRIYPVQRSTALYIRNLQPGFSRFPGVAIFDGFTSVHKIILDGNKEAKRKSQSTLKKQRSRIEQIRKKALPRI